MCRVCAFAPPEKKNQHPEIIQLFFRVQARNPWGAQSLATVEEKDDSVAFFSFSEEAILNQLDRANMGRRSTSRGVMPSVMRDLFVFLLLKSLQGKKGRRHKTAFCSQMR